MYCRDEKVGWKESHLEREVYISMLREMDAWTEYVLKGAHRLLPAVKFIFNKKRTKMKSSNSQIFYFYFELIAQTVLSETIFTTTTAIASVRISAHIHNRFSFHILSFRCAQVENKRRKWSNLLCALASNTMFGSVIIDRIASCKHFYLPLKIRHSTRTLFFLFKLR